MFKHISFQPNVNGKVGLGSEILALWNCFIEGLLNHTFLKDGDFVLDYVYSSQSLGHNTE